MSRSARVGLAAAGTAAAVAGAATHDLRQPEAVEERRTAAQVGSPSADDAEAGLEKAPTPIELEVDPKTLDWPDDHTVDISGTTAIDASNPRVAITVLAPSGRRHELEPVPVSIDGSFATTFELNEQAPEENAPPGSQSTRPRVELGTFQVKAVSPGGFGSASASFTVSRFDEVKRYDWADPADQLAKRALDLVANLKTCVSHLPVSPAREDLKPKLAKLEAVLAPGGPSKQPLGSFLALVMKELGTFPDELGWMEDLIEPLEEQMDEWGSEAKGVEQPIRHDTGRCSGAGTCDAADMVLQDLERLAQLTTFLEQPVKLIAGYGQSPALKEQLGKVTMVDTKFLNRKLDEAKRALEGSSLATAGLGSVTAWFYDVRHATNLAKLFAGRELFEPYCQKFEGPFTAHMEANFSSKQGKVWWRYTIALTGQLTLRYPAKTLGPTVPMTGELTGCATGFKSWDNALHVGWPKLMAGAMVFRTVKEPFEAESCVGFDLPVKAELRDSEIVLEIEPASRTDYGEPVAHVRYVIVSPLAGGLPAQTSFDLPYKNAHFILTRALENKPLKLPIRKQGKQLVVATELKASRGSGQAQGSYAARIKACNPSCAMTGTNVKGSKPRF
ncbi:MAG: hypothetical protein ACRD2X_05680 [Vicinamibacteraceae bacterium]